MHELISKYFKEEITTEEKQELFSRIHTDETWKKEYIAMQNIHGLTAWLPSGQDEAMGIDRLLTFKQAHKQKKASPRFRHWIGYAAAMIVSVLATWSILHLTMKDVVQKEPVAAVVYEEFTAPPGQRALIRLQDGTTVWLNARTTLRYPNRFSASERRVELDGEAFFEVTENQTLPFIVSTEKLSVKVTGTKFNVFAYKGNSGFSTSLTEGSVVVYDPENKQTQMELKANERAVLEGKYLRKETFTNTNFLLWKEGIYAFDNVPFHEMARKLELYYEVTIINKNKELENFPFNCKFRQRDGIESALRTLKKIKHFTYTKDDEKNIIIIQ